MNAMKETTRIEQDSHDGSGEGVTVIRREDRRGSLPKHVEQSLEGGGERAKWEGGEEGGVSTKPEQYVQRP